VGARESKGAGGKLGAKHLARRRRCWGTDSTGRYVPTTTPAVAVAAAVVGVAATSN
jgi:hypothetical protein